MKTSTTKLFRIFKGNVSNKGRDPIRARSQGKIRIPQGKVDVNIVARITLPTYARGSQVDALNVALRTT